MATLTAATLVAQAAAADTRERQLAALLTLEAVQPGAILGDPETVMTVAENVDGAALAAALDDLAGTA